MTPEPAGPPMLVSAEFTIEGEDFRLTSRVTVPAGPTRVSDLLPVARALSDAVVRETSQAVEGAGEKVSCKKGCGACCRNLVAISEVEARRIRAVVEQLPEPRRDTIRARFSEARERLERAGLLDELQAVHRVTSEDYTTLVGTYFQERIACPFLEDELPLREFIAVARCQVPPPEHFLERWVPLILAPEWAAAHPDDPPPKPGPELLRELLDHLRT